jgi:F-type H+-transporting ATPase subunit delta
MERLNALYASALFDLALERNNIDESLSQAVFLRDILHDTGIMRILMHPHISRIEKQNILTDAFDGKIQKDLVSILRLTIDKNRQAFMVSILDAYIGLIEKFKRIVTAKVITATELDEKRIEELRDTLTEKLNKTVRIEVSVDPSVIAGPYIYVDGYYLDWTFKTRLRELTVHMKEGCTA